MSTRSQITILGQPIYLYKHSDGYPEGVLPVLEPFAAHFFKHRGYDPMYFMARLVMAFGEDEKKYWEEFKAENTLVTGTPTDILGFGLDCEIHGDIEYLYVVDKEGQITVKEGKEIKLHNQEMK